MRSLRRRTETGRVDRRLVFAASLAVLLALNVVAFVAPIDYGTLGGLAYVGAFAVCLLATAAVVVPVPYLPVVAQIAADAPTPGVVAVSAALGSVLGESVGYALGRLGRAFVPEGRFSDWLRRVLRHPVRAWFALAALAAPVNPFFDVAGIAAGALGLPYLTFFTAVLAGRLVRFAVLVALALRLLS